MAYNAHDAYLDVTPKSLRIGKIPVDMNERP